LLFEDAVKELVAGVQLGAAGRTRRKQSRLGRAVFEVHQPGDPRRRIGLSLEIDEAGRRG
jgi:hypothetical protein